MTIIAYSAKHGIMASDSRCSDDQGRMHLTNCQKIFRLRSGALIGTAGDSDERDVIALLSRVTPRTMPTRKAIAELIGDMKVLIVFPKGQTFLVTCEYVELGDTKRGQWAGEVLPIRDPLVSIGSGCEYAYGAMEHGASPIEAVRIACRRDLKCALPVQWERIGPKTKAST